MPFCCLQGGVIVINIVWNCNLDRSIDECLPQYSFSRLDLATAQIAKGSNFRCAHYGVSYVILIGADCRCTHQSDIFILKDTEDGVCDVYNVATRNPFGKQLSWLIL